jgi:hypothetical protein
MNWFVWETAPMKTGWAEAVAAVGWTTKQTLDVFFGRRVPEPLPHVKVTELTRGKLPEVLMAPTSTLFVNRRLHDILAEALGDGVQFLTAEIKGHKGEEYWIANVTQTHPCMDRDNSDYDAYPDPPHAIHTVRKLVMLSSLDDAPPIFHCAEMADKLIVRDDVRKQMETKSSYAGTFVAPEKYTRGVLT